MPWTQQHEIEFAAEFGSDTLDSMAAAYAYLAEENRRLRLAAACEECAERARLDEAKRAGRWITFICWICVAFWSTAVWLVVKG